MKKIIATLALALALASPALATEYDIAAIPADVSVIHVGDIIIDAVGNRFAITFLTQYLTTNPPMPPTVWPYTDYYRYRFWGYLGMPGVLGYVVGNCAQVSCTDGTQNQGETGVDCGGPCGECAPADPCAGVTTALDRAACTGRTTLQSEGRTGIVIGLTHD